jgi:uncharacterized membrane protein YphA (DoxX/SURF4 family)
MAAIGFVGRFLIAALFLASGFQKLIQTPPLGDGYTEGALVQTKLNTFAKTVKDQTGFDLPLQKGHTQYLLQAAIALELVGGVLFLLDSSLGALLLITFLVAVTPIMHDFWNETKEATKQDSAAHAFKNLALIGALVLYLAKPSRVIVKSSL